MKVDDIGGTCTLMKVIYVLRHHCHFKILFKPCHKLMATVWHHVKQLPATLIVEREHKLRVGAVTLGGSNLLYGILIPQTTTATECTDTALGAHSGTCKYNNLFHESYAYKTNERAT
jgi:hypothetical protein